MIKAGDIIDGRKVTRVYYLCGCVAYDSVPAEDEAEPTEEPKVEPEEKPKRRRKKYNIPRAPSIAGLTFKGNFFRIVLWKFSHTILTMM